MYPTAHTDPRGGHNRININHNFFQNWSPVMAYVLGFIFADGTIEDVQKSSRTCYISITSKDLSILEKIRNVMQSHHQFYKRLPQSITFSNGKRYITSEEYVFRIGSKLMYNDLLNLGLTPRKSLNILFPTIPPGYLSHFIRGYFDGDGCIYLIKSKYPRIIFTSGSNQFLEGLSTTLSALLQIPRKRIYYQLQQSNNLCYRLYYNTKLSSKVLEFMYRDLEKAPYLERKFAIYQSYLNLNH